MLKNASKTMPARAASPVHHGICATIQKSGELQPTTITTSANSVRTYNELARITCAVHPVNNPPRWLSHLAAMPYTRRPAASAGTILIDRPIQNVGGVPFAASNASG